MAEFHFFNKLPTEIRIHIWTAALPGPRLVQVLDAPVDRETAHAILEEELQGITIIDDDDVDDELAEIIAMEELRELGFLDGNPQPLLKPHIRFASETNIRHALEFPYGAKITRPVSYGLKALLSTCRESYEVASKHRPYSFGNYVAAGTVRFNYELDILYLREYPRPSPQDPMADPYHLCNFEPDDLARVVRLCLQWDYRYEICRLAQITRWFPNLKEVYLEVEYEPWLQNTDLAIVTAPEVDVATYLLKRPSLLRKEEESSGHKLTAMAEYHVVLSRDKPSSERYLSSPSAPFTHNLKTYYESEMGISNSVPNVSFVWVVHPLIEYKIETMRRMKMD